MSEIVEKTARGGAKPTSSSFAGDPNGNPLYNSRDRDR